MLSTTLKSLFLAGAVAAFAGLPAAASAAVLLVDDSGQLTGARNVDVGGKLFDVQFVNGSCIGLFGGCDEASDTDFANETDALAAAQALLDQVFLDTPEGMFDSDPELTFGCSDVFFCDARIPFEQGSPRGFVSFATATNSSPDFAPDSTDDGFSRIDSDTADRDAAVYARFTESVAGDVPAPGALSLLGLGLAGLAVAGRRRKGG
ncbi:MAG: PEP-CTERM sorting domain-containing protein [Minwuiales bacterium]|nr:PEP-CTERM sorting domain-containing protein [Minwuiales bacterium]